MTQKPTPKTLQSALRKHASAARKASNEWFFKTGKGEYGEHDIFIGVRMPDLRSVAKEFHPTDFKVIIQLLNSKIHEDRLLALIILTERFKKNKAERKEIFNIYLQNFSMVNNWDLVDASAHKIVGEYILEHPGKAAILRKYAKSHDLWEKRLSIVATWALIRAGDFALTMELAEVLLPDERDLTHKAVGWMLREVWKRDEALVEDFLCKHYAQLPRTTLRYAIERMDEDKRQMFLRGMHKA